jgi:cytochrome c biogenesis protein ResB
MKTTFYVLAIIIAVSSCTSYKDTGTKRSTESTSMVNDTVRIANDSLAYEILILEPGFNAWLVTQRPRGFYAQTTMEQTNFLKVTNYNLRVNNPIAYDANLYVFRIDYDRNTDYGYEVNYMLYHYFLFLEERYTQRLR